MGYPTRAAARAALQSWHNTARPVLTTGQWLTRWLATRVHLRASTLRAYESHVRLYLLPHLGGIPLADLQADDVAAMLAAISRRPQRGRPLSAASQTRLRATLGTALSTAQRRGFVERNAASDLELSPARRPHPVVWSEPRVRAWRAGGPRPAVAVWTAEQTATFLDGVDTDPMGLLFRLIALRGLRRGEACGLFWSDLDTTADGTATLTIGRQLVEVRGAPHLTEPKSAASCRTVALDADTASRLADRRRHTGAPDGPMFTTATGRALRPGTVTNRFASLVAAGGLPPVRLHDLRHGAATLALAAGADLKVIQDLLGHASIVLTADTYTSVLPAVAADSAEAVARLIRAAAVYPPGHQAELLVACRITDLDAFTATVQGLRRDLGQPSVRWSAPCLGAAIQFAVKVRSWPAAHVRDALLLVAADPHTRSPMRLAEAGPWWDHAQRPGLTRTRQEQDELDGLEATLADADDRATLQLQARQQLAADSEPVTRLTVARRACRLLEQQTSRSGADGPISINRRISVNRRPSTLPPKPPS